MTDAALPAPDDAPTGGGRKGLLIGAILALVLGGAGFGAVYAGLLDPLALTGGVSSKPAAGYGAGHGADAAEGIFLPLDPITVSLAPGQGPRHLRLTATIETAPGLLAAVETFKPRVLDVLIGYLRAVDTADLEDPAAMPRLRAQMLRRVQLVAGGDDVRDILITEFILN